LDSCVACNSLIDKKAHFSNRLGGLICQDCIPKDRYSSSIFPGTVASILHIERSNWQKNSRLAFSLKIESELKRVLNNFLVFHLEKRMKSSRVLNILNEDTT
ncbi:MAG: DNA repair protein RecO C-terminal domain-containing protein, partial [Candidatus Omnitrophota bacterium]